MQLRSLSSLPLVFLIALTGGRSLTAATTTPPSAPDASWSGSVECKLDLETAEYSRHETQTWTITGPAPNPGSVIRLYPAKWHYTGHGSLKKGPEMNRTASEWNVDAE